MDEKLDILNELMPLAVLKPLTPEALAAVPQSQRLGDMVLIRRFPFRIGRESRVRLVDGRIERIERPKRDDREPNNDLYLLDQGQLLNISREHLQIEDGGNGCYTLVDRGSSCGTKIANRAIGGSDAGGKETLHDGEVIGIGAKGTPFLFKFVALAGYQLVKKD